MSVVVSTVPVFSDGGKQSSKTPVNTGKFWTASQNRVYDILSAVIPFTEDKRFWWETTGSPLARMFQQQRYSVQAQFLHMLFFFVHVVPFMGPQPTIEGKPKFKSYMTDDYTPLESSWVVGASGETAVRYAIEPIDLDSESSRPVALRMLDELQPVLRDVDLRWFWILNECLISHTSQASGLKHGTQHFLGFDCAHNGEITLKAYFLPEIKSAATGIAKEQLVLDALRLLDAGLVSAWQMTTSFFDTLEKAKRPDIEIVATDCSDPQVSRIKVYCRTRATTFGDLEAFLTLEGKLRGQVIDDAMDALVDLWNLVMGMDTSSPGWKDKRLSPRGSQEADNHITGGLLLYYELKPGNSVPYPKVYLPVRHYCANDLAIASGMEAYYRKRGIKVPVDYLSDVKTIFGGHRSLRSRTGIHTYIALAIKKTNFEVTNYFNPESFAQERFSHN